MNAHAPTLPTPTTLRATSTTWKLSGAADRPASAGAARLDPLGDRALRSSPPTSRGVGLACRTRKTPGGLARDPHWLLIQLAKLSQRMQECRGGAPPAASCATLCVGLDPALAGVTPFVERITPSSATIRSSADRRANEMSIVRIAAHSSSLPGTTSPRGALSDARWTS